eukprot:TRINITY_DN242_c4_g1_i1.p1 TRINITY_DN242_c4_g1~~TRINITY_DN242_c4_g1_i1.p1  ORF type:complete len:704 (-),score=94.72 TRINITY_DN242_c4_g1_i1:119-2230(-)
MSSSLYEVSIQDTPHRKRKQKYRKSGKRKRTLMTDSHPEFENEVDPVSLRDSSQIEKEKGSSTDCLIAKTTLILPFKWGGDLTILDPTKSFDSYVEKLCDRFIISESGTRTPLWIRKTALFSQNTYELDSHFLKQIGLDSTDHEDHTNHIQRAEWLEISSTARSIIFRDPRLEAITLNEHPNNLRSDDEPNHSKNFHNQKGENALCKLEIESVSLLVFRLGAAILQFHINWLSERKSMSLEELRGWLYLVKFRHQGVGIFRGWNFGDYEVSDKEYLEEHLNSLGGRLSEALYNNQPITLTDISNWLLSTDDNKKSQTKRDSDDEQDEPLQLLDETSKFLNSDSSPKLRSVGKSAKDLIVDLNDDQPHLLRSDDRTIKSSNISSLSRVYHHTVIVVKEQMKEDELHEYLFHLRRGKGQINRPPPGKGGSVDKVIQTRCNRYIGISREGTVSISWPLTQSPDDTEFSWPKTFQGIYRILTLHVHGERAILSELSGLTSLAGNHLEIVGTGASLNVMAQERKKLLSLMVLMTRFTLQMSSDDCGGQSDHVEFFIALREVFSIKSQRKEITQELRDVYHLVESTFYEEQRKITSLERLENEKRDNRKSRFETIITVASSFTLPIVLMSGIFGMNNADLPNISFYTVIIISGTISAMFLIFFLSVSLMSAYGWPFENKDLKVYLEKRQNEIESLLLDDVQLNGKKKST